MIGLLKGTVVRKSLTDAILDVGGVGYAVIVPLPTSESLATGKEATLHTHLHVREDALQLYGFATEREKELFTLLLTVNGIGPKAGIAVLSGIRPDDLHRAIDRSDTLLLSTIPGIGKKIAERIVLELRGKIGKADPLPASVPESSSRMKVRSEAVVALMALGHSRSGAELSVRNVVLARAGEELTVEELVRAALSEQATR
jgi:Holliday junction DNA helicase RuvA